MTSFFPEKNIIFQITRNISGFRQKMVRKINKILSASYKNTIHNEPGPWDTDTQNLRDIPLANMSVPRFIELFKYDAKTGNFVPGTLVLGS